ncbi:MAG: hypothetical protein OXF52_02075 [Candidatus Dadabacteria bacterium]|nr:hypothetical protein [Candidatus Dadabacteria bacterium]
MSKPEDYVFEWPVFPKDETERDLQISEVAMREGANGFPDTDSSIFSITENEVIGRIRRFYVTVLETVSNKFIRLGEETAHTKLYLDRFDIGQLPAQLKARVDGELTGASVSMSELGLKAKIAKNDFELFKKEHGLTREPVYSPQWRAIWGPAMLLFLFFLEVALNGALVASVVEGLIAGISVSTTVATLNVLLSFVVGKYLLPELNVQGRGYNLRKKLAAFVGILVHLLAIIYLNLVFGIFRSIALEASKARPWEGGVDLGTQSEVNAALRPWAALGEVNDIPSLFVIGVGFVFAAIALIDGYGYDDHYPGYGDVHRKFVKALEPFEKSKRVLSDKVHKIMDETTQVMDASVKEFEVRYQRWGLVQNMARQQFSSYAVWVRQLEQDANKLINDYRAANIKGRHTSYSSKQAPSYFDSRWTFSEHEKDPASTFSHIHDLINKTEKEDWEKKNALVQQEMSAARNECAHSLRKFLQELQEEYDK